MDIIVGLPCAFRKFNLVLVIVDRLIKYVHLISVLTTYSLENLVHVFMRKIIHLHRVPIFIISDQGSQLTSHFRRVVQ